LEEAEHLAERVAVIASGRIIACDAPSKLGGRNSGQAIVSWVEGGDERSERTDSPTRLVNELATRFPGEIPDLTVRRPTLEDTYLTLLGEHADNERNEAQS